MWLIGRESDGFGVCGCDLSGIVRGLRRSVCEVGKVCMESGQFLLGSLLWFCRRLPPPAFPEIN